MLCKLLALFAERSGDARSGTGRDPSELMQSYIAMKIGEEGSNLTGPGGR